MAGTRRFRARVRGRVQGVFFRASTADEARRLGLAGWVRNEPDGAVALEAEGEEGALEALLAWCRVGPPAARVDDLAVEWIAPTGEVGFAVRR
jgi:acylphosphatase